MKTAVILEVSPASPFASINFSQPWLTVRAKQMNLRVNAPNPVI